MALMVSERFSFVKRTGLCINCLRKGHVASKCPSKSHCPVCNSSHHTTLHIFSNPDQPGASTSPDTSAQSPVENNNAVSLVARTFRRAIIPTAVILIKDICGVFQPVRALLDSCSELNFITEEAAKRLKLRFRSFTHEVSGIGELRTKMKFAVETNIKSRINEFQRFTEFAVIKTISAHHAGENIDISRWQIPSTIELADPIFFKPQRIDILLNTEIFFESLLGGHILIGNAMPRLTNTAFGWIVGGTTSAAANHSTFSCNLACTTCDGNLNESLQQFLKVEEYIQSAQTHSEEKRACENHFLENVRINDECRIQLRLPFKIPPQCLRNSYDMARKRFFLSLERHLERDPCVKSLYVELMDEYASLGHMSPYTAALSRPHYVIPHHCVLKPQSTTTKSRVVFDASARSSSSHSLNAY